jgi:hypothetical protein
MDTAIEFVRMNAGTIVTLLVVLAAVTAIIRKLIRDKKKGGSALCSGCTGCSGCAGASGSGCCHEGQDRETPIL